MLMGKRNVHCEANKKTITAEYRTWLKMRRRCNDPKCNRYAYYGGRGIKVCERWDDYRNFLADMGRKPSPAHTLDRIDVNGDYTPGNCRWASRLDQGNNTTANTYVDAFGRRQTIAQWSRETGVLASTISYRLRHGWAAPLAVGTPARKSA
jgi:hypothetical protein